MERTMSNTAHDEEALQDRIAECDDAARVAALVESWIDRSGDHDLARLARELSEHLRTIASCETSSDVAANIAIAKRDAPALRDAAKVARKAAKADGDADAFEALDEAIGELRILVAELKCI